MEHGFNADFCCSSTRSGYSRCLRIPLHLDESGFLHDADEAIEFFCLNLTIIKSPYHLSGVVGI